MGIAYLLDEHMRGPLWRAIRRHNAKSPFLVDAVRVGDADAPSLSTPDPDLLLWCEEAGRILVSFDEKTLPGHLTEHLHAGHHAPGIFLVRPERSLKECSNSWSSRRQPVSHPNGTAR
jgi:hypothetical protein